MPGQFQHSQMTREAFGVLPDWARARFPQTEAEFLTTRACVYPDLYFDHAGGGHQEVAPYALLIDGIQFHYLPNTPIEGEYKHWRVVPAAADAPGRLERVVVEPNENWRFARTGFTWYLEQAVAALRDERPHDAAALMGYLAHLLEDSSTLNHSLEGPNGADFFVLDRLLEPPGGDPALLPSATIPDRGETFSLAGYQPRLLGASVPEAVLHLYASYARTAGANRKLLIPICQHTWAGDTSAASALRERILAASARQVADAFFTILSLAAGKLPAEATAAFRETSLVDLEPIRRPRLLSSPYRFVCCQLDAALDSQGRQQPLAVMLDGERVTFERGLGTGVHFEYVLAYELPPGLYGTFSTVVGLHADLSCRGDFTAEILLDGAVLAAARCTDDAPAARLEAAVSAGGRLELRVRCPTGLGAGGVSNNLVWGSPVLSWPA